MLVVLDTNAFHSDVHGTQPRLSGILDGPVNQAAFEVFVPEVVMLELDKQFAQRSKKVVLRQLANRPRPPRRPAAQ